MHDGIFVFLRWAVVLVVKKQKHHKTSHCFSVCVVFISVFVFAVLLWGGSQLVKLSVNSPSLLLKISIFSSAFPAVCIKVKVETVGSYKYLCLVLAQQYWPSVQHSVPPQEATVIQQLQETPVEVLSVGDHRCAGGTPPEWTTVQQLYNSTLSGRGGRVRPPPTKLWPFILFYSYHISRSSTGLSLMLLNMKSRREKRGANKKIIHFN